MIAYASGEETALFGAGFAEMPSLLDSTKQKKKTSLPEQVLSIKKKRFKWQTYLAAIALG